MITRIFIMVSIFFVSPALGHDNVQNLAVKMRMQAMKEMAQNMKKLKGLSTGSIIFDKTKAYSIVVRIGELAEKTPALFQKEASDPESEAKPEIWLEYQDFSSKAENLKKIAFELSQKITNSEDAKSALRELGGGCKACHQVYKN
ncbi:MAG: hypothetical protein CBB68_03480 [Rhodospirillaceae bacterium TMED8]|nr:hypothetical protein [Magnetovibrio sp.]OUT51945.1 MAG: hypothetical protein CBB68_03480 [Rhodospirillaceae bacterium TMED8]|tara:strand:- start:220 stop:654 length:435 start_codon:yes stop_codon:yes gene_type:complete